MSIAEANNHPSDPVSTETRSVIWRFLQAACRTVSSLAFDLKVYGPHRLPEEGGMLMVANHQSYLDPILLAVQLNRPVSYLAKSELFTNRYFAWLIRSLHAFPVRQGEGDVGAVRETIRRLREGHVLNIFPEGTRTPDGLFHPIQPGIALIIRRAGVPVVPVAIWGAYQAWPTHRRWPKFKRIRLMYGKPMDLKDLRPEEIVRTVQDTLARMIDELTSRCESEVRSSLRGA